MFLCRCKLYFGRGGLVIQPEIFGAFGSWSSKQQDYIFAITTSERG